MSELEVISAGMMNTTNGAKTTYNMSITPNTHIADKDRFYFRFPEEFILP